ncbi:MAG TPA: hypothetical protein VN812_18855 [Candidatus Acidoferrales bacterium]|nr:hypothetical protein [Candidatus Acidoferrales bacterium]
MRRAIRVRNQRGEPQPGLLHNMSVPSKTVVSYSGLAGVADAGAGGSAVRSAGSGNPGIFGRHLRFALPETVPTHDPALLLQTLGIDPFVDPMCELEHLIEARARELPLPDACLVVRADPTHPCRLPDVLSALAVLAKCSEHVWLREKRPNLSRLATRREVSLLLPPQFSDRLQEFLFP